jgi:hypothetical protein
MTNFKKFLLLFGISFILFLVTGASYAQLPSRVSIRGVIKDTNNNVAGFAVVMLLSPKDSTLLNYTQSNETGAFAFNNVRNTEYLLKISHISFLPLQVAIHPSPTAVNDLGMVKIKPIAKELFEVVIKEARAPLYIRGDTIEYDATTFKVPVGSTVEDLLRRLPGIDVDVNGNIQTQGKDVKRVYVDGKTFFGDDPTSATKNIDANAIAKVQVFDEKSEQSKLTGIDDGSKEKAMNLALKDEFKKGNFGKITAAGGTNERWAGRGNFNRFDKKNQLSFIGYANNINETGVNWEDYSEFKGQNAFNDYDNGDFGFSSGMGRYYGFSYEDSPLNYFDGRGFTKNYGAGTNYNFDNTKTKFNISYFYNYSKLNFDEFTHKETFLSDSSFNNDDTNSQINVVANHSLATRIEQDIDSNNKLIAKVNFRYKTNRTDDTDNDVYSGSDLLPYNALYMNNGSYLSSWKLTTAAIYRLRFKKAGRSFALSAGYNNNQSDRDQDLYSENTFYSSSGYTNQIDRLNNKSNDNEQIKASVLYTEPVSKYIFWEIFYNFNQTNNKVNNEALNHLAGDIRIDSLSAYYTNKVMINRLGTDFRYSNNGLNIMMGVAGQDLKMDGKYYIAEGMPLLTDPIIKDYKNLSPKFNLNYEFPNNMWLECDYGYTVEEPSFDYLQPVPNVSNPAYRMLGNPDLKPEHSHQASINYNYYNPSSFSNFMIDAYYTYTENKIINNQKIDWVDSIGYVTTSKPDNNGSGNSLYASFWGGFPIIKTVFTMNMGGNFNYGSSGSYVNEILNKTVDLTYGGHLRFNITPGQKLVIGLSGGLNLGNTSFSISKEQNQKINEYSANASVKWQFLKKFFFESNFSYEYYHNSRFGNDKNIPIWNASVRRLFGKKNHFEVRLAAFDIFNKRVYIQQYASSNYVVRSTAATLARYFMLSVSYNIRGYEDKLKKDRGGWF